MCVSFIELKAAVLKYLQVRLVEKYTSIFQ